MLKYFFQNFILIAKRIDLLHKFGHNFQYWILALWVLSKKLHCKACLILFKPQFRFFFSIFKLFLSNQIGRCQLSIESLILLIIVLSLKLKFIRHSIFNKIEVWIYVTVKNWFIWKFFCLSYRPYSKNQDLTVKYFINTAKVMEAVWLNCTF